MQTYKKPTLVLITMDELDVIRTSGGETLSTDPCKKDLSDWDMIPLSGGGN